MPTVKPFKAIRYNAKKVKSVSSVIAPPYDVIPKKMQDELYRKNPYNVVRLILNKISSKDTAGNNRYTRSKKAYDSWMDKNVLVQDEADSFYIYSQIYKQGSKTIDQVGFIGLMSLELDGSEKVLPHENTLAAPKKDRLALMNTVGANLSPIFILHDDKNVTNLLKKFCAKNKAIIDVKWEGVRHVVWKLSDADIIDAIKGKMEAKNLFIADGHHRYEVAKMYARQVLASSAPENLKESARYMMVYFVEADEKMLTVLPTHRLIKDISGLKEDVILKKLEGSFDIYRIKGFKNAMAKLDKFRDGHAFGIYLGKSDFYVLKLKDVASSDNVAKDRPKDWRRLDVSILHLFVLKHLLGISDEEGNVEYMKDPLETARAVDGKKFKAAFFLNPTKVSEVKQIARLGERMPRKSTYFYPKPLTGLVINKH
ncbi:MAG: DUF1015 domain-containing protein [Candidatus Omnitrophota bacterium]